MFLARAKRILLVLVPWMLEALGDISSDLLLARHLLEGFLRSVPEVPEDKWIGKEQGKGRIVKGQRERRVDDGMLYTKSASKDPKPTLVVLNQMKHFK